MAIHSIFVRAGDPEPQAVADRFSWFAALLPPLYAAVHGLWWGLLAFVAAAAGLYALSYVIGGDAAFWLYVMLALFIGFEAGALRRANLRRRNFAHAGERLASGEDEAALTWLDRRHT